MSVTGTNISLTLRQVKGSELTYSELDGNQSNLKTGIENHSHDEFAAALGVDDNYVTDAEKSALHSHSNKLALDAVTGTNTGDQDLSGYALISALHNAVTVADSTSIDLTLTGQQISAAAIFGSTPGTVAEGNHAHAGVYEPADATILKTAAIGVSVQAYDADLTSWAGIAPAAKQDSLVSGTNIKTVNGSSILGSGDLVVMGGMSASAISTTTTGVKDTRYICDTTSAGFTLTLPATPAAGDYLEIVDAKGTFQTNNLTIARNGSVIDGVADDLVCDISNIFLTLTYSGNSTRGWQIDVGGEETIVNFDGDKGDITVSGSGATWTVDNNVITPAKMARTGNAGDVLVSGGAGADPGYTPQSNVTAGAVSVVDPSKAIGYGTGAGGTVTQATSKSTAVTLNKPTGKITMNNAALAAGASVQFTLNNSLISALDTVIPTLNYNGNYTTYIVGVAAGAAAIVVKNVSAGSLSDAVVLNFAIIKGASS